MIACPACGRRRRFTGTIAFCECGHRWLLNSAEQHRQVEDDVYTDDYQGYRPDPVFVANVRRIVGEEFVPRVPPPARILDVGCGAGESMLVAREFGYAVEGIDVSEAAARICRSKGLDARSGDFLTAAFDAPFDLVTMWDVVEHLRDPGAFIARARELLTDRGLLFAKVPGFGGLSVRLSAHVPRLAGTLLGAPDHVQYFTRDTLSRLLDRQGFTADWLGGGAIRSPVVGGSLKRRLARKGRAAIRSLSGDSNLTVLASPAAADETVRIPGAAQVRS